jgi:hypothetical protein
MPSSSEGRRPPSSSTARSQGIFGFGHRRFFGLVAVVWLCASSPSCLVSADWGDYADLTFQCPALTTCQRVCVANVTDCR